MIIASINHKGGTGKSIVAQNLGVCFANNGYKVCVVDANAEQNSSIDWFNIRDESLPRVAVFANANARSLRKTVEDLYNNEGYEIVLIDSPPSLSRIAEEILLVSHLVVLPISTKGANDVWSTEQMAEKIQEMSKEKGRSIPSFMLLTHHKPNVNLHTEIAEALTHHSESYNIPILKTTLNDRVAYGKANRDGKGVYEGNDAKAKAEIIDLYNEIHTHLNSL